MKYIKPFDIINKYKIGDYILIDLTQLEHDQVHLIKTGEKLPEDYGMTIISDFDESEVYPYSVTFYTGEEDFIKDVIDDFKNNSDDFDDEDEEDEDWDGDDFDEDYDEDYDEDEDDFWEDDFWEDDGYDDEDEDFSDEYSDDDFDDEK